MAHEEALTGKATKHAENMARHECELARLQKLMKARSKCVQQRRIGYNIVNFKPIQSFLTRESVDVLISAIVLRVAPSLAIVT